MAEVVAPSLDLENGMTAQVVIVGGITLKTIQTLGEAMDLGAMDDDDDSVFYDADELLQENRSSLDPVAASCEEPTQTAAGGEDGETCLPHWDADGSEPPAPAGSDELPIPNRSSHTELSAHPLCQEQEEADRTPSDERERESLGSESADSSQLLGDETEMLDRPQSGEPVCSGNEVSGESLSLLTAESTQPVCTESETLSETLGHDDESRCLETEESAESLSMETDMCTPSLVAESEELPQPECIETNAESSLIEECKVSSQSTCIESGESTECVCDTEESEPKVNPKDDTPVLSVCTESGETIQPLCGHKQSEPPLCPESEELVPSLCSESGQSTHSGSISDGEGMEPSQPQEGQPLCKESAQPDTPASIPGAASCPSRSQPMTDSSAMAGIATVPTAASEDTCSASLTNQGELEETAPDSTAHPTKLPSDHNMTTEGEHSGSPEQLTSTEPQRLMTKETQTEVLGEASATSQTQPEQEKTAVEAAQEEQSEGTTGGNEAADTAPVVGATGESDRPSGDPESPGDRTSGDDLTGDSQDELADASEARQSDTSGSGSSPSGATPSTTRRKKPRQSHSFNKSKFSTVSYRKIRRGNTRQRIDAFEAMNM